LDRPIAIACFLLVTFLPLLPLLSFPSFMAFISVSTLLLAAGEYFRAEGFLAVVFFFAVVVAILISPQGIRWRGPALQLHVAGDL
jgi:hypothetical protein